jgi:hypothetical protein
MAMTTIGSLNQLTSFDLSLLRTNIAHKNLALLPSLSFAKHSSLANMLSSLKKKAEQDFFRFPGLVIRKAGRPNVRIGQLV